MTKKMLKTRKRRVMGRLRPLTIADRARKALRNERRGREPRRAQV